MEHESVLRNLDERIQRRGYPFVLMPAHLRCDRKLRAKPRECNQRTSIQFIFNRHLGKQCHAKSHHYALFDGLHTGKLYFCMWLSTCCQRLFEHPPVTASRFSNKNGLLTKVGRTHLCPSHKWVIWLYEDQHRFP